MSDCKASVGKLALALTIVLATADALAGDAASTANAQEISPAELAERHGLDPSNIGEGPVAGLYEIVTGTTVRYVTKDGQFLIAGPIVELDSRKNLTEQRQNQARAALLRGVDDGSSIVFSPANGNVKHRITVFTDVDCGYCRQLHREIDAVTDLGIEVRYLSWPRTGPNTEAWFKAERVWCADDRRAAITSAKLGTPPAEVPGCASDETIRHDYELGKRLGVDGTPAVYTENGVHIGGYIPAASILSVIEQAEKE